MVAGTSPYSSCKQVRSISRGIVGSSRIRLAINTWLLCGRRTVVVRVLKLRRPLSALLDPFQFRIDQPNGFCISRDKYMDEAIELVARRRVLEIDRLLGENKGIRIART